MSKHTYFCPTCGHIIKNKFQLNNPKCSTFHKTPAVMEELSLKEASEKQYKIRRTLIEARKKKLDPGPSIPNV